MDGKKDSGRTDHCLPSFERLIEKEVICQILKGPPLTSWFPLGTGSCGVQFLVGPHACCGLRCRSSQFAQFIGASPRRTRKMSSDESIPILNIASSVSAAL